MDHNHDIPVRLWQEISQASNERVSKEMKEWRTIPCSLDNPEEEEEALRWVLANALKPIWRNRDQQSIPKSTIIVKGDVTFKPDENLPEFAPFAHGLEEDVVCVFANEEDDDRAVAPRSLTLRFHKGGFPKESKFDLKMETGLGLYKDFESYKAYKEAFNSTENIADKEEKVKEFMLKSAKNYSDVCWAFVKDPPSVLSLVYNSNFPLRLEAKDGSAYFAKFRAIPNSEETWTGLTEEDQREFWNKLDPTKEDERRPDYLKEKMSNILFREAFIGEGSVRRKVPVLGEMRLQVMVAKETDANDPSFFLPDSEWAPWLDLGMITITRNPQQTEALLPDYLDQMRINSGNLLPGISIVPPTSTKDPRWCLATRAKIEESCSNLREVLGSSCTIEAQAKYKGQGWKNHGWDLYQELTGRTDAEMAIEIVNDFSSWSRCLLLNNYWHNL